MGFFTSKKEVKLEGFCRDFYENYLLNPKIGEKEIKVNTISGWVELVKKAIVEFDNDTAFANVDVNKLTYEFEVISYELFALAWMHSFGDEFAFEQSMFTNKFLQEKGKNDIWISTKEYNEAIGSSATYGLRDMKYYDYTMDTSKFFDKQQEIAKSKGFELSDSNLEIIRRTMYRKYSEKAWETGATILGLTLALLQRLGLLNGNEYQNFGLFGHDNSNMNLKISDNSRLRLNTLMYGLYDNAKRSFEDIKIIIN